MLSRLLSYSLAILALFPAIAVAEGLLYQLPDDGQWVRFEMVQTSWKRAGKCIGTLTVSSVGTEEIDGRKCRWVEIDYDTKGWVAPIKNVYKLLIPEEHLGKGKDPLKHVVKAWYKHALQVDSFFVLEGEMRLVLVDDRGDRGRLAALAGDAELLGGELLAPHLLLDAPCQAALDAAGGWGLGGIRHDWRAGLAGH